MERVELKNHVEDGRQEWIGEEFFSHLLGRFAVKMTVTLQIHLHPVVQLCSQQNQNSEPHKSANGLPYEIVP